VKLTVLSVGKDRSGLFAPGVEEYAGRLQHYARTELIQLPESRATGDKAKAEEGEALLKKLSPKDVVVALDERGKELSTLEFAEWIGKQQQASRDLGFLIGGDEGLSQEVRSKAGLVLCLSRFTLPHRLARLVLMEQLYRAFTVLKGEAYHRT
jgi:23S rRNA (pseudouridine1915-N3)-methyltransferase